MAKTPRTWQGARTPSGLKRVRTAERRHAILQPRRTAAKSLVKKALAIATAPSDGEDPQAALALAISALDRAAKVGAIHPNAAARRKSRLASKVAAAVGGTTIHAGARGTKTTGTTAAQKAAKARIAAGKAAKAKGAQTAAGKARAALTKTARTESGDAAATPAEARVSPARAARSSAAKPPAGGSRSGSARAAAGSGSGAAKTTAAAAPATKPARAKKPAG